MHESLAPAASSDAQKMCAVAQATWQPYQQQIPGRELNPSNKPFVPASSVSTIKPQGNFEQSTHTD